MFTPQEIQEKTFSKAMFGGYDMQTVDEFLEPLTQDYITLYNENAVLRSKMKALVEKLEDYREQETSMKKALVSAQRTADEIVENAKKKSQVILSDAYDQQKKKSLSQELAAEQERVDDAKKVAQNFIASIEKIVGRHMDLLEELKNMDLTVQEKPRAFDQDAVPMRRVEEPTRKVQTVADEIERNLERAVAAEQGTELPPDATRVMEPLSDARFNDLQFGRNYDPKN